MEYLRLTLYSSRNDTDLVLAPQLRGRFRKTKNKGSVARETNSEGCSVTIKAVIAMMEHETNTFSPVPTPIERFGGNPLPSGEDLIQRYKGTGTGLGGFLDVAVEEGMEIVAPVAGNASPSGYVEKAAYETMSDAICEAVAQGVRCLLS